MAYNINKSDGTAIEVPTGAIDNQFDIPLIGQDAINYGDDLALAFVRLLENFASNSEPTFGEARVTGQLWYDKDEGSGTLKIYDGTQFTAIPKTSEVVLNTGTTNISGTKIFSGIPQFNGGDGSNPPFEVDSTFQVDNLNAENLSVSGTATPGIDFRLKSEDIGKQSIWVPADQMYAAATNGAAFTTVEITAGQPDIRALAFDPGTDESAQFTVAFPNRWDRGAISCQIFWTTSDVNADNVYWNIHATAFDVTENLDGAFPVAVEIIGANPAASYRLNRSAETALTVANGPQDGGVVFFRIARDADNGLDTLASDALLLGVKVFYTSDQPTDA